jgi:two-component system sensor histidine kinase MprB
VTLRDRLTLLAAGVVAVVVVLASTATYFLMRHELQSQLDGSLRHEASVVQNDATAFHGPEDFGGNAARIIASDGSVLVSSYPVPIDRSVRQVARGERSGFYRNITVREFGQVIPAREIVAPIPNVFGGAAGAVLVVKSLQETNRALERLRLILILVSLGGVAVAASGARLLANATLAPVRRLTAAAERIARTGEPSERVPEGGTGELARLGHSFNTMLAALEESLETQRRFVADASHELRTPLTSLQTNIDVLRGDVELDPEQRRRLLDDLDRESQEMRVLIAGLLELARGGAQLEKEPFQLDEVVEDALARARTRFPGVSWETGRLEPTVVDGYRERMDRAVWNLLENAGKWSGDGSAVEISLVDGELRVRDHGPGFADEDQPLVFDRFYRSAAARSMPGAGLGLAIVREVAEAHGGTVVAENADGGGAVVRLSLNGAARTGSLEKS